MLVARRAIVVCEWVLIVLFGILLLISALDLPWAVSAQSCSVRPTPQGCYPWGGEGPAADAGWSYASKRNYLASGFFHLGVISIALVLTFFLPPSRRILVLLPAFALLRASDHLLQLIV